MKKFGVLFLSLFLMIFMVPIAGAFDVQGPVDFILAAEQGEYIPGNVLNELAGSYDIEKIIPYNSEIHILALSDPRAGPITDITVLVHSKTNIVIGYTYQKEGQTFYVKYHAGKYQGVMAKGNTMTNL